MKRKEASRRGFIRHAAHVAAALPVAGLALRPVPLRAQAPDPLSEDDPAAFALGYVASASDVDVSKYPRYEPGQVCANCQQWQGEPDEQWARCAIFPGNLVANAGWCSVWVRRAG